MKKHLVINMFVTLLVCCLLAACPTGGGGGSRSGNSGNSGNNGNSGNIPAGAKTYTANGRAALPGSSQNLYYEMWTEGGSGNKLIWYGPSARGGAAFRAEWKNPNDFLGRVGYYYNNGGTASSLGTIKVDFAYTRATGNFATGSPVAGNYSYIGIYGWSRNPLIEYYIVEDWFGNQWNAEGVPVDTPTTGGTVVGTYSLDGASYKFVKNTRTGPSIDGNTSFTQYFAIRQSPRKSGTISVSSHFAQWATLGNSLGNSMYEVSFLVEAGGGTGWLELSNLKFYN